jgi:pyruvate kinase
MAGKVLEGKALALHWRRTKIIATLGPASGSPDMVEQLLRAGVDVVRLNLSHGNHDSHRRSVALVRETAARLGRHVAILADLRGPKLRTGRFEQGAIQLGKGSRVVVTTRAVTGCAGLIPSQYRQLHRDVRRGERILLDDGRLELRVLEVEGRDIRCKVVHGGRLSDHKGMNLPDSRVSAPAFTAKDKEDAALAVELELDFLALSFVRDAADIKRLNRYLQGQGKLIPVISKIERPEAVTNIDEILVHSYGIMIARGDLGIELPAERVPLIQRELVAKARQQSVPVIVATQMLESMIEQPRATRAEVGDVANAAMMSADAVMLSGETAAGKYPLQAVETMDRVLREVEKHQWEQGRFAAEPIADRSSKVNFLRESMAHAAMQLTRDLEIEAIVVPTRTGTTARIIAAHRPISPTVGVCARAGVCRRMALHWGIVPVQSTEEETHDWRSLCHHIAACCHLGKAGHDVLLVAGFHDDPARNEPSMKVLHL